MVYDTAYIDSFMSRVLPNWFGSQVNTKEFPNKGGRGANTNGLESYFYVEIHKSQTHNPHSHSKFRSKLTSGC
jgi:hypothetical protein